MNITRINHFTQIQLHNKGLEEIDSIQAAKWLDTAGLLKDSEIKPGLPLRKLLKKGLIIGQYQETNRRWFIRSIEQTVHFQKVREKI